MSRMVRAAAVMAAAALLGAAQPHAGARYFLGTWKCGGVSWTFSPLPAGGPWIRNVYGDPAHPAGTAVIGYVDGLHAWVYRDFHADGAYADLTSPGPVKGRWVWSGPYYPAGGGAPLSGRIGYVVVNAARYDRVFEMLKGGKFTKMGGDTCAKVR